jgi:hypothetical protein
MSAPALQAVSTKFPLLSFSAYIVAGFFICLFFCPCHQLGHFPASLRYIASFFWHSLFVCVFFFFMRRLNAEPWLEACFGVRTQPTSRALSSDHDKKDLLKANAK